MPANTFLESWGDYSPQANVTGLLQPAMGHLFRYAATGDILLATGKGYRRAGKIPGEGFLRGPAQRVGSTAGKTGLAPLRLTRTGSKAWSAEAPGGSEKAETPRTGKDRDILFLRPRTASAAKEDGRFRFFYIPDDPILRRPSGKPSISAGDARSR